MVQREVAGRLAERVTLERRQEVRDALGGSDASWNAEAELWAAVTPDRGGVAQGGDARRGGRRWAVMVRRRDGLGLDCRLLWGARILRVRFVEDDPRVGDVVTLRCEEEACSNG
jgi:head-tail adaptor